MKILLSPKKICEVWAKNIMSKSEMSLYRYSINPYIGCTHGCKYCYAAFMKKLTQHSEDWGNFLDVKYWRDIKRPKNFFGKTFLLSSVTDPYNPQEKKFKRTRYFLEQMQDSGAKITIQTKSDLVLRDI